MNSKGDPQDFKFEKAILSTDDILEIRNTFTQKAKLLGFQKPQLTLMTTAVTEVGRLFFDTLDENQVTILRITNHQNIGIGIKFSGNVADSNSEESDNTDIVDVIHELDSKLKKVKKVFPHFDLAGGESNNVILSLKNWVTESDIHFPNKTLK